MIEHHPSDEVLLRHAAGRIGAAPALVLQAHLEHCPACRDALQRFEALGGVLLEDMPPVALTGGSLDRALATIARPGAGAAPDVPAPHEPPSLPGGAAWPAATAACEIGPWRWLAPGMRICRIHTPDAGAVKLTALRIGPGRQLLRHSHVGQEWTYVICGSFADEGGRYGEGAFIEADDSVDHQPRVDSADDCVCLIAMDGRIEAPGLFGRLMRLYAGL